MTNLISRLVIVKSLSSKNHVHCNVGQIVGNGILMISEYMQKQIKKYEDISIPKMIYMYNISVKYKAKGCPSKSLYI